VAKAVLTTKVVPDYDDLPEQRYHFPKTYLNQVQSAVDDFAVYYEPRRSTGDGNSRGGRQAYFAVVRIDQIRPDERNNDHYYADVSQFLEFDHSVPFKEGNVYYESGLQREDGKTSKGAFGRAVRNISDIEFDEILKAGFSEIEQEVASDVEARREYGLQEEALEFERPIVEKLSRRLFRDKAFSTSIKTAYDDTCAFTGLKIINGGGRSEVQAAHIRPVSERGPDSVRNGLALSGTVHWMFDRGLLSISDDLKILTAAGKIPPAVERLLLPDRKILLPRRADAYPHPEFLAYHRNRKFKG
jgi:putative restriction endonuclease